MGSTRSPQIADGDTGPNLRSSFRRSVQSQERSRRCSSAGLPAVSACPPASVVTAVSMPFIEPLSDANLERLALEHIVPGLLSHGFYYVDGLLGDPVGGAVLDQVKEMHRSGKLQDGQLAGSAPGIHRRSIRGDKIAWVSGSERGCEEIGRAHV